MRFVNEIVLSDADTANATGAKIDSNQLINASFHAYFGDATAVGSIKIQASNDICHDYYQAPLFTPTNWVDVPNATASISAGGSALISMSNMAYRWLRVLFVYTSGGSSTVTVSMFAQGL